MIDPQKKLGYYGPTLPSKAIILKIAYYLSACSD